MGYFDVVISSTRFGGYETHFYRAAWIRYVYNMYPGCIERADNIVESAEISVVTISPDVGDVFSKLVVIKLAYDFKLIRCGTSVPRDRRYRR